MLKRVHIAGFKSLADVEVRLEPLTVLFGPNAAGKSNFLDALHLLSRMARTDLLADAFTPPYRGGVWESFTLGPNGVEGLFQKDAVSFSIEVDVNLSATITASVESRLSAPVNGAHTGGPRGDTSLHPEGARMSARSLRYRIRVEFQPKLGNVCVAEEMAWVLNPRGKPILTLLETEESRVVFLDDEGQHSAALRHRDHSILRSSFYRLDPHLVALREELASWLFFYFEPREKMRKAAVANPVRHIGPMGEDLAVYLYWLRRNEPKQFEALERALQMVVPSISHLEPRRSARGEVELWIEEDGTVIPASVVSEGTLRMVGLLVLGSVKPPPSVVGFEEPENGIHPGRVELVGELLKTRSWLRETQLIVTTHSPLLVDQLPPGSLRLCEKMEGSTRILPLPKLILGRFEKNRGFPLDEDDLSVGERWVRGALRRIALFCEDAGHQRFLDALIRRLARERRVAVSVEVRTAAGGRGRVQMELRRFVREIRGDASPVPDLVVVATDANCQGHRWRGVLSAIVQECPAEVIYAVPEPHIERWLLVDSRAFHEAVGRGCDAPDRKCDKDRYKQLLREAVRSAGLTPEVGGLEHTEAIVNAMDLDALARSGDASLRRLLGDLRGKLAVWGLL